MKKTKRLLVTALAMGMVAGLFGGCSLTAENGGDTSTVAADKDGVHEPSGEICTNELTEALKVLSEKEEHSVTSEVIFSMYTEDEGQKVGVMEFVLGLEAARDENGNTSFGVSLDYEDLDGMDISENVCSIAVIGDMLYLDFNGLYDLYDYNFEIMYWEKKEIVEGLQREFDRMMVLEIPLRDLGISQLENMQSQELMDLIWNSLAGAMESCGEDVLQVEGDTYVISLDQDQGYVFLDALLEALEEHADEICEAYLDSMKSVDYETFTNTFMEEIMNDVIAGVEMGMGNTPDDETLKQIEEYLSDMSQELKDAYAQGLKDMENAPEEFVANLQNAREQIAFLKNEEPDFFWDIEVRATISDTDVQISAPESYATISQAVSTVYKIYMLFEDMESNASYNYTDTEILAHYGITPAEDQELIVYFLNQDAVLVTEYEGFTLGDDRAVSHSVAVMRNSDQTIDIRIGMLDNAYLEQNDFLERKSYEEREGIYYAEEERSCRLLVPGENYGLSISINGETEEALEEFTGGDYFAALKDVLENCQVIPAP